MKKLVKILTVTVCAALLLFATLFAASAASGQDSLPTTADHVEWTEDKVIKVYDTEAAYLAAKESGIYDKDCALSTNKLGEALSHASSKGKGWILLTADYAEGRSFIKDDNSALQYASVAFYNKSVTVDLNGKVLSLAVNRWVNSSGKEALVAYQRFQTSGSGSITVVGNGGTLLTASNLVQFSSGGGSVTLDGGVGGLNVVACTGYTYNVSSDKYVANTTFSGSEGIIKNAKQGYSQTSANVVNILGEVTYVRENGAVASFICAYPTVGGFDINIGEYSADKSVRNTAVLTALDVKGSASDSGVARLIVHRDDAYDPDLVTKDGEVVSDGPLNDVLVDNALLSTVNITNATVNCKDQKFSSLYNKNYEAATDDDLITYNIDRSTLNFKGFDNAYTDIYGFSIKSTVSYRININGSEIYDGANFVNSSVKEVASATENTVRALTVIKNSYVSVTDANDLPTTFVQRPGTIIAEDSYFNVGAFANLAVYWIDYNGGNGKLANGSVPKWPTYAKEVGGYGAYVKDGNYFTDTASKGNDSTAKKSPGENSGRGFNSNKLGSLGKGTWYDDTLSVAYGRTLWYSVSDAVAAAPSSVSAYYTFDGKVGSSLYDHTSSYVKTLAGASVCIGAANTTSRPGKFTVAKSALSDGANTYLNHTYWEEGSVKYSHSQPYVYFEANNTFSATDAATHTIKEFAYYAIDLDLMTRTRFTEGFNPQFFFRSYYDGGSVIGGASITLSEDGTWKSAVGTDSYKMSYTPGKWQHLTFVLEMPLASDGSVDILSFYEKAKIHLFSDGKFLYTFTGVVSQANFKKAESFKGDGSYAGLSEVRIAYGGTNQKGLSGAETSLDNVFFTRYPLGSGYSPADISGYYYTYRDSLGLITPPDVPLATYGDKVITADNAEAGLIEYYKALLNGTTTDALRLYADFNGSFDPLSIAKSLGKGFVDIKCISDGYTFNVDPDKYSVTTTADVTTVTRKTVTTTWYAPDGSVYETVTSYVGDTLTVPKAYTATNNWYRSYYTWVDAEKNELGSTVISNVDTAYYCRYDSCSADMQLISYNLRFMGHVGIELYVPEDDRPDGIKSITVYNVTSGEAKTMSGSKNVKAGGKYYTRYGGMYAGALNLGSRFDLRIEMTVETPDGETVILPSTFTLCALDYLDYVVSYSQYYKDQMPLVADMLQFSMELYKQINGQNTDITKAAFYNLYNKTASYRTPLTGEGSPEFSRENAAKVDPSALGAYATGLRFVASNYESGFALDFKEPVKDASGNYVGGYVTDIDFIIDGYLQYSTDISLDFNFNSGVVTHDMRKNLYYATYSTSPLMVKKAQSGNISVHNITDDEITIVLHVVNSKGETEQVRGTYNLDAYYYAIADTNPNFARFLTALKAYSESAILYRYGGVRQYPYDTDKEVTVSYSDFGAVGNGIKDDFDALYRAHNYANSLVDYGYTNVTVVAEPGKTYLIGDQGKRTISIKTDTDWTGANFIFNDIEVSNTSAARGVPIFQAVSDHRTKTVTGEFASLKKDATNIGYAPGYPALAIIYNENHRNYIRYGSNADNGFVQQDIVLVDAEGNIDPSTPLLFDTPVTSIELIRVDDSPITIKGGYFKTVYNHGHSYINYSAYSRGILISRSNTTITGAVHEIDDSTYLRIENSYMGTSLVTAQNSDKTAYTEITKYGSGTSSYYEAVAITGLKGARKEENLIKEYTVYHYTSAGLYTSDDGRTITENGGTDYITYGYKNAGGSAKSVEVNAYYKGAPMAYFIRVERANNVEVNKCVFENPKSFYYMGTGNNMVVMGSYENTAGHSNDVRWTECFQTNFRDDDGNVVSQGQMGSNYCKNMLYDGNVLSRLDAHKGAGNITVRNCEIGRVNIIGGGQVLIEDSIFYSDSYMINLRNDYGSIWMGDVTIDNVTVYNGSNSYLCIFNPTDFYNHDFGYETVAPTNVYINDLTVIANGANSGSLRMYFGYLGRYVDTTADVVYKTDGTIYKNDKGGTENLNPYTLVENLVVTGDIYAYKNVLSWKEVTHPTGYKTLHPVVQTFNANGTVAKSAPTYKLGFNALSCPSEYKLNIDTSGATVHNQFPSGK